MTAKRCRYGDLLFAAGLLTGLIDPDLVRCDETAAYNVIVATHNDGVVISMTTPMCPVHEAHVVHNPGYKRSIKLRAPAST